MKSFAAALLLFGFSSFVFAQETCLDLSGCYASEAKGELGIKDLIQLNQYKCSSIEVVKGQAVTAGSVQVLPGTKIESRNQSETLVSVQDYGLEYSRYKTVFDGNGEVVTAEKDLPPGPPDKFTRATVVLNGGSDICGQPTTLGKTYLVTTRTNDYDGRLQSCEKYERQAPAVCEAFKKEHDMPANRGEVGSCTGTIKRTEEAYYPENDTIERVGTYRFVANLIQTGSSEVTALIHETYKTESHIFKRRFRYYANLDAKGVLEMSLSQKSEGTMSAPEITGTVSRDANGKLVLTAPSNTDSYEQYSKVTCTLK